MQTESRNKFAIGRIEPEIRVPRCPVCVYFAPGGGTI